MPTKYQKFQPDRFKYCTGLPDKFAGVNHAKACFFHDKAYSKKLKHPIEEVNYSRKLADQDLVKRLYKIYSKANKKLIGLFVCFVAYVSTRIGGIFYWKKW